MPKTHSKTAQKILSAQKQPPAPTLFLGNLGFETTDADIVEMLSAHRSAAASKKQADGGADEKREKAKEEFSAQSNSWIRKVRMGTFEDSGLCKGCVIISIPTPASTRQAGLSFYAFSFIYLASPLWIS